MSLKSQIESLISVPHEDITTAIKLRSFNILLLSFWTIIILMNSLMVVHSMNDYTATYGLTTVFDELFICLLMCASYYLSTRGHLKSAVWVLLISMIVGMPAARHMP